MRCGVQNEVHRKYWSKMWLQRKVAERLQKNGSSSQYCKGVTVAELWALPRQRRDTNELGVCCIPFQSPAGTVRSLARSRHSSCREWQTPPPRFCAWTGRFCPKWKRSRNTRGVRSVLWRLVCSRSCQEYRLKNDGVAISARPVHFVIHPVRQVQSPDGGESRSAATIDATEREWE